MGPPSPCVPLRCISIPGLPSKGPQTQWLQVTDVYAVTVLEAASPKSGCLQGQDPSEASRGGSLPASS